MKASTIKSLLLIITTLELSMSSFNAYAQRDTSNSVVIIVPTNPSLSDGRKLELLPQFSRLGQVSLAPFTFTTIDRFSTTNKTLNVLPPIAHYPESRGILPNGFARLGYGNLNAWNGNVYLANNSNPNNAFGFRYNHFSTNIPKSNKDFSRNEVGAFAKLFKGHEEFGVSFDYSRDALRFYNLPDSVEQPSRKDVTRNMEQWNVNFYYKMGNINYIDVKPYFRADIDMQRFNLTGNQFENSFQAKGHMRLNHDGFVKMNSKQPLDIVLDINVDRVNLSSTQSLDRYFVWVKARDKFTFDVGGGKDLIADVGFDFAVYADSLQPQTFITPYLNLELPLIAKKVTLIAGADGEYKKQGFQTLFTQNPFIQDMPNLENQFTSIRLYGGFNANVAPGTVFTLEAASSQIANMPLFVGSEDPYRRFALIYDNGRHAYIKGQLNFNLGDKTWVNLIGIYNDYKMANQEEAWLYPDFEVKLRAHYILSKKLFTRLDVLVLGNRTALDENAQKITLKPIADLNLGLDYHFKKNFFAFVQANNIAGTMYQRWYHFPVYGFNATAGIGVKF